MMSTGLPCDQVAGRAPLRVSMVSCDRLARSPPMSISRSTARTPAPPPLVTMPTRPCLTGRNRVSVSAASNRCSRSSTRNRPARVKAASIVVSLPASAPVWVAAASAAAAWRPDLITITGFIRAAARAADMNLRAWGHGFQIHQDGMGIAVAGQHVEQVGATSTSAISPRETTAEKGRCGGWPTSRARRK